MTREEIDYTFQDFLNENRLKLKLFIDIEQEGRRPAVEYYDIYNRCFGDFKDATVFEDGKMDDGIDLSFAAAFYIVENLHKDLNVGIEVMTPDMEKGVPLFTLEPFEDFLHQEFETLPRHIINRLSFLEGTVLGKKMEYASDED